MKHTDWPKPIRPNPAETVSGSDHILVLPLTWMEQEGSQGRIYWKTDPKDTPHPQAGISFSVVEGFKGWECSLVTGTKFKRIRPLPNTPEGLTLDAAKEACERFWQNS